ncbi:AEC family transporter [Xenophilus arseniciresistens]|uniref:AEC family transporter n=1 Tax=Xenophilus arseniciresistens TaxID=1283306 RepID=A0AAE3NA09_9BURK|nr:AEC family transporter [Xenophilus arseniciresistens]MDA7417056.1 AEC family transporter [Xenophilus arseniciresistens]
MLAIFFVTFPFFALIAAGYAAARLRLLPLEAIPGLNLFLLYFALPCMLFRFGANTPIAQLLDGTAVLVWCLAALGAVGIAVWLTRRGPQPPNWNDTAFGALVAAFPNTGFMGVPLLVALLGASAAAPVILTMLIDMVLTSSLCLALSRLDERHGATGGRAVWLAARKALQGAAMNPLGWSILLGALASAMQWKLWGPLDRTIGMLGDAASPAALFTIGAVLARSTLLARAAPQRPSRRAALRGVLPVVAVKLLVHPLLVAGLGWAAMRAGLPLPPGAWAVLVLAAALPSASNVSLLAERFGADNGRIARIILWTTVATFFSFPLVAGWVG